jgi:NTE family protein
MEMLKFFKKRKSGKLSNDSIGLALGGGSVLGAAHIGVLRAIAEMNIPIKYVAGTSIGSFVGSLFSFGKNWEEIKEIALELDWLDISSMSLSQFSLFSNKRIEEIFNKYIGDVHIEDAKIPLTIVVTDISQGERVVLKKGKLAEAVMASTCLPGIFKPIELDDRMLVDGGLTENVPVLAVQEMGAKYVIGVDLNAKFNFKKPGNILELLMNSVQLALMTASRLQTEKSDLVITPDVSEFNMYDTSQVPELIDKGYEEAKKALKKVIES